MRYRLGALAVLIATLIAGLPAAASVAASPRFPTANIGPIGLGKIGCLTHTGTGTAVTAAKCQDSQNQRWTIGADQTIRIGGPTGQCLGLSTGTSPVAQLTDCTSVTAEWFPLANHRLENLSQSISPSPQSRGCLAVTSTAITISSCFTSSWVVMPGTAYGSTNLIDRADSGGNGNWALDTMTRQASVTYLGMQGAQFVYEGSITDNGSFVTFPGAYTPNQGLDPGMRLGDSLIGQVNGHWGFSFATNAPASTTPPAAITGYGKTTTPNWYQQFFAAGTTFTGTGGLTTGSEQWSWSYQTGRDNCGKVENWTDANNDNAGQNTGTGATDITAPAPGATCG